ncbi:MAG: TonB-dependent receptor [Pseudomonadota bacterium]
MPCFQLRGALLSGASILVATSSFAQQTPSDEVIDLGTIRIFGDKFADSLDQTTASVAVLPEQELNTPNTQTLADTFRRIANVQDGARTESGFIIRGINSEGLTPGGNGAPLASIYIDGVQQTAEAARRGFRGLFDVEQVEVYRGPQSTLSGRNALAGAIYLQTKDPDFVNSGAAQLTYGENNHRQVGLAYGGPINDSFAFRLAGEWSKQDSDLNFPTYERFPRLSDLDTDTYYTVRGKVLWQPADNAQTRALLSFSHSFDSPTTNDIAGPNQIPGVSFDDDRGDVFQPPFVWSQDVRETRVNNAGLEITHDITSALRLTALTTVSESTTDRNSINLGVPAETFSVTGAFDQRIVSQEVRLNFDSGPLRWVAGVYGAKEMNQGRYDGDIFFGFPLDIETTNTADITNLAVFGEFAYEFARNWRLIAGGRVDYTDQDIDASLFSIVGAQNTVLDTTNSETEFLPKIGLEYDITADQRIALVYQQGYRPGGAGLQPVGPPFAAGSFAYEFDPESTDTIELSYRGDFIQGRLNVGANLFYTDYKNQQVEVETVVGNPFSNIIVNAGDSESYGAEIDVTYQATDLLTIFGAIGLLHTEFKDFTFGAQDLSGQQFRSAPERTISVGASWGDQIGWFANGLISYVGPQDSGNILNPAIDLGGYTTVDASGGYAWNTVRLTVYANNLFDKRYFTGEEGPGRIATLGDRREIGVRLDKTF